MTQASAIEPNAQRFDEQMDGLKDAIAINPHEFVHLGGNGFLATTREFPQAPAVAVIFTVEYQAHTATLRHIQEIGGF